MSKPIKSCPECVYGNRCHRICVSSSCRKPAFICEHGLVSKSQCALFHEHCETMLWSQLQNIICQNPNTKIPQMFVIQQEMQTLFSTLIKKLKQQHMNFKKWISLFGFNFQTMNFINMVNQHKYNNISGVYINQIISGLFMDQDKNLDTCFNSNDVRKTLKQLEFSIQKIRDLYAGDFKKQFSMETTVSLSNEHTIPGLESRIFIEHDYIRSLFPKKTIKRMNFLYRASQNNFSAVEFHKKCDGIQNTLTLIETEYGKIIGGYTPLCWNSNKKQWAADKSMSSFIFSLDLREKFNLNLAQFAIANHPDKGPVFGCCDINIVDKSNIEKSNAQFPISYNNLKYARSSESSQALTGNVKGRFTTKEWEVFKIQFIQ